MLVITMEQKSRRRRASKKKRIFPGDLEIILKFRQGRIYRRGLKPWFSLCILDSKTGQYDLHFHCFITNFGREVNDLLAMKGGGVSAIWDRSPFFPCWEVTMVRLPDNGRFWKYGCRQFVGQPSHTKISSLSWSVLGGRGSHGRGSAPISMAFETKCFLHSNIK